MHKSVLLKEVIDGLELSVQDKVFLDATLGAGGHSAEVCRLVPQISIIGIDADLEALKIGEEKLKQLPCKLSLEVGNYRDIAKILDKLNIKKIDKALFDLGMSSMQVDLSGRGFSFQRNEPLLMTMRKDLTEGVLTAYEIVNSWPKNDIAIILKEYGEETFASKISEKIIQERKIKKIRTTFDLVEVIKKATPKFYHHKKIHPATKTFQALRIAVNDELNALNEGLGQAFNKLRQGGRIAVISFHSLEDRIVKNMFKQYVEEEKAILINKKPITPTYEEVISNRRSRSAKLRIIKKLINNL